MTSLRIQMAGLSRATKIQLGLAIVAMKVPVFLFFAATSAAAGPEGSDLGSAGTQIVDMSPLTTTESTEALGLNSVASALPAGVAEMLDSSDAVTVFAPTDDAFRKIPENVLDAIAANQHSLKTVLVYHVSPGEIDPRKVAYARKIDTLAGQSVFLSRDRNGPMVNQSDVECQGYRTANGLFGALAA